MTPPLIPLDLTRGVQVPQLGSQLGDPTRDAAPIGLQLRLTGTASADPDTTARTTTGLAGQVATPAPQALAQVLQLRQLDLGLAFRTLRVSREDVEDQRRAVNHLDLYPVLEVTQLCGRQLSVADHGVRACGDDHFPQLIHLAPPDVGGRVWARAPLYQSVEHLGAGRLGQQLQFGQRVLRIGLAAGGPHADQHHTFQLESAVLDLRDVLKLGGHPGDPAQRLSIGEILLSRLVVLFGYLLRLEPLYPQLVVIVDVGRRSLWMCCHIPTRVSRAAKTVPAISPADLSATSEHRVAAVNHNNLAGHEARGVRCQVHDAGAEFDRHGVATHRSVLDPIPAILRL